MANFNVLMRDEITRIARKVSKSLARPIKTNSAEHRRGIARIKRELAALRREVSALRRATPKAARVDSQDRGSLRFSPRSVAAQRKRLGLSADRFGRLVGVSGQTVYNWEQGKRPRAAQLASFDSVRGIGKREAQRRLEALEAKPAKRRARR